MTTVMQAFADVTFFDVARALVVTGLVERLFCLLPDSAVGDGGWLLDTGAD